MQLRRSKRPEEMAEHKKRHNYLKVIWIALAAVFLASVGLIIYTVVDAEYNVENPYSAANTNFLLDKYAQWAEQNADMVGWVKIENTAINSAVMQTVEDEDHYLTQGFEKDAPGGLAFVDARCSMQAPSLNTILYAATPEDGTGFANLHDYRSEAYYLDHPAIQFDTLYAEASYEIFAVITASKEEMQNRVLTLYEDATAVSKREFKGSVRTLKKMSLYETDITPEYGDLLLTLCTYEEDASGLCTAVIAKRR